METQMQNLNQSSQFARFQPSLGSAVPVQSPFTPSGFQNGNHYPYQNHQNMHRYHLVQEESRLYHQQQVQRWANWVKFIAVFIIIKNLMSIFIIAAELLFTKVNTTTKNMLLPNFLESCSFVLVGMIGFRVSLQKTVKGAKVYIFTLILLILVEFLYAVFVVEDIIDYLCEDGIMSAIYGSYGDKVCDDKKLYMITQVFTIFLYVILFICIMVPIICCPYKMIKHTKIIESSRLSREESHSTEHFQSFGFNPVIGRQVS
jgi:hypothetical protein